MDLKKLDLGAAAEVATEMVVVHPITGEDLLDDIGNKVTITLYGAESAVVRNEIKRRAIKHVKSGKSGFDFDDIERKSCELLALATVDWHGLTEDGVVLECDKDTVVETYLRYSWLREQVDKFINDRENFWRA